MNQTKCALCDIPITEANDSREHVIPNSIGGKKKIKGFICNECNNSSGDDWESELSKQLNPLSLFFGITRDRGSVPSQTFQTTGGEAYVLNADGSMDIPKPVFTQKHSEKNVSINIQARSIREAKTMLKGVKRKYPQVDLDELLGNANESSTYCPDMLQFNLSFGGHKAGRSIVKSALALVVESGIPAKFCEHALEYLRDEDGDSCFGYYYEKDLVIDRPPGIPIHCVYVKGFPASRKILGYVEFFGVQRMVLCLSSSYEGPEFTNSYSINPISGESLDLTVNLHLSSQDINDAYEYRKIPNGAVEEAFNQVIPTGMKSSFEKEKSRVVNSAVQHAFANCGAEEGSTLEPEHIEKLAGLMMEKLEPFILHQFSNGRGRDDDGS